jgi:ABC-type glycerol-3-phosphate transport system substrate-binding protein
MKLLASLTLGGFLLSACSSELTLLENDVPASVVSAFQKKYPGAIQVEWEVEKSEGRLAYEAEFRVDGIKREASFRIDGTFLKEEID